MNTISHPLARLFFALSLFLLSWNGYTQFTVTNASELNMTPEEFVAEYLIGNGISISNVTFNKSYDTLTTDQIGVFLAEEEAYEQLGLDAGIVMTSGMAAITVGPNNMCSNGGYAGTGSDEDLEIIAGDDINDKAVIEFDFVPESDTISFRYVFGSEEIWNFCNSYNDAFGFFLSGPGIEGIFSNDAINIALMPESGNWVTLNNMCDDISSTWCNSPVDCPKGGVAHQPPSYSTCSEPRGNGVYLQYNGLTYVFTAWHVVIPCSTYHIKLAVGDALDTALDSGVFLEKNSFSASGLEVFNTYTIPALGNHAIEGCSNAIISFVLPNAVAQPYTVNYTIEGTAINGIDYTAIIDSIVFPTGSDSVTLVIEPLMDETPEGIETVIIGIQQLSCSGSQEMYDTIFIYDNTPLEANAGPNVSVCPGDSATLIGSASGSQPPYDYTWIGFTPHDSVVTVSPVSGSQEFFLQVTDGCTLSDTDTVLVGFYPLAYVTPAPFDDTVCSGTWLEMPLFASLPDASFSWTASQISGLVSGYADGSGDTIYQQLISINETFDSVDYQITPVQNGCIGHDTIIRIYVDPGPVLTNNPPLDTICDSITTQIILHSNYDGATFTWTATGSSALVSGYSNNSIPDTMIAQTLSNAGLNYETVVYHIVPAVDQCIGDTSEFLVHVAPVADVWFDPLSQTICSHQRTGISLHSHAPTTNYTWTANSTNPDASGYADGSGDTIQQILINHGFGYPDVVYTVTPMVEECPGNPDGVVVTILPPPPIALIPCFDTITTTNAQPIRLRGNKPLGGTFSGNGIYEVSSGGGGSGASGGSAWYFDPAIAGPGTHEIKYTYTNEFGCLDSANLSIVNYQFSIFNCGDSLLDIRDSTKYPTVEISGQCWMASNLNYGTQIASAQSQRDNCIPEKYCFDDTPARCASHGALYQWDEVMQYATEEGKQGFCPPGWHIPTETDWEQLFQQFTASGYAGSGLKYNGYTGFDALLTGIRFNNQIWKFASTDPVLRSILFWSSTYHAPGKAWAHGMNEVVADDDYTPSVSYYPAFVSNAFAVRCIKDY
jgi:uncharacterized protein (TIGR02145 family)